MFIKRVRVGIYRCRLIPLNAKYRIKCYSYLQVHVLLVYDNPNVMKPIIDTLIN